MKNTVKFLSISLGLIVAGCSSSGGGSPSATPQTTALSTGGVSTATDGTRAASLTRNTSASSTVVIGGRTYNTREIAGLPLAQVDSARTFALIPSNNNGGNRIRAGRHVDTAFYFKGTNLLRSNERISQVGAILDGDLTPTANLPAIANYRGTWNAAAAAPGAVGFGEVGNFTATADFGPRQKVTGNFRDTRGQNVAALDAKINGNEFSGEFSDPSGAGETIDINGGFFGPNAEEIAGAGAVVDGSDKIAVSFIGSR